MKLNMTIDEALEFADEWSRGMTLHEGSQGWRVVCMLLAEEVRRMREGLTLITCESINAEYMEQNILDGLPAYHDNKPTHYAHIAYFDEYPEEGSFPLGAELAPPNA